MLAALLFLPLLPYAPPQLALAFGLGATASFVTVAVLWSRRWGCTSEADGVIVEHNYARPPPSLPG